MKVTLVWAIKDKEEPLLTILKLNKSLAFDLIHFILKLYNLRVAFFIYVKTFMNQPLTFSVPYKMSTDVIDCWDYNPTACIRDLSRKCKTSLEQSSHWTYLVLISEFSGTKENSKIIPLQQQASKQNFHIYKY